MPVGTPVAWFVVAVALLLGCSDGTSAGGDGGGWDAAAPLDAADPRDDTGALDGGETLDAGSADAALGEPDTGTDPGAAPDGGVLVDAGRDAGSIALDAGLPDAGVVPPGGACDPYGEGVGIVSSLDCAGSTTPICDAVTRTCSARRAETPCGPCRSDADCEGTYPGSICVRINEGGSRPDAFMPRGVDYACALRCSTLPPVTSGCGAMMSVTGWSSWECTSAARIGETTATQVCLVPTSASTGAGGCRRDSARRVRDIAGGG
jgi:hypothetical protein